MSERKDERGAPGRPACAADAAGRKADKPGKLEKAPAPQEVTFVLSPAVVSDIVRREALNAPGVTGLASGSFIGRGKGISVSEETGADGAVTYRVEVYLYVEYGTNCPKLKGALAERIAGAVHKMTGRELAGLTMHIEGVRDPVAPAEEEVEEPPETPLIDY